MATQRRKIEVHRLTISGLVQGTGYGRFLTQLCHGKLGVADVVMKSNEKFHALNGVFFTNRRLRMRFMSYKKGHRPDVLDTDRFSLQPNPLKPTETNVEWTHVLGSKKHGRYVLLVERNFSGIWPTTLGKYLQWLIDEFFESSELEEGDEEPEPVTVTLEAEPGLEFIERIDSLERVTEATVRVVRPNPGWKDLETELGKKAGDSDARRVDVTMAARRRASLNKGRGILQWIREAFGSNDLGFAAIKGRRGRQSEAFNTEKLGKHVYVEMDLDERG